MSKVLHRSIKKSIAYLSYSIAPYVGVITSSSVLLHVSLCNRTEIHRKFVFQKIYELIFLTLLTSVCAKCLSPDFARAVVATVVIYQKFNFWGVRLLGWLYFQYN